ncbi:MAG TPA: hypothetical protein VKX39_05960 [Bryobacteraceae bacterium]|jgi:hypothetical protein|nr:hypothetical protein [Bryobacteraceae bacterium]
MTAQELCDLAELNDSARQLAQSGLPARTMLEQIVRGGEIRAAIGALAQALPRAEAIAWALSSIRAVEPVVKKPGAGQVLEAIEKWLGEPDEQRRRAVREAADRAGIATPAGCLGMAVFYSGGSIGPADSPVSPEAPRSLCGKMAAGAIALAVALEPLRAAGLLREFFDAGMRRANDLKIWEKDA